jgi:G3E family GTPase
LTVRVTGMPGVYGVKILAADGEKDAGRATFGISYFPMPDEDLVESFSIDAGLAAQAGDYLERVREFTLHPDLRVLFHIAGLETFFTAAPQGVGMALSAPEHDVVIAADGLEIQTPSGPVQAVSPGGTDQNFPAWDTALPLFNALAASASFCLGDSPDSLTRHSMASTRRTYGMNAQITSETCPGSRTWRLGLGWNTPVPPDRNFTDTKDLWQRPASMPGDFADALWLNPNIQGAGNSIDKRTMGISDKPRLIVLTGFLGSGKTTFLARFIEEQAAKNGFVAVIQNEIGQKGLDGKLMGQHYAVTEVDEGCVCCTLAGSLRAALSGILSEFQPDFVVLETTGLANPANLLSEIADLDDLLEFASVTTMVDAAGAARALDDHEVARSQVRLADVLLVNKADLVSESALDELETRLRTLNTAGTMHRVVQGDIPAAALYGVNFRNTPSRPAPTLPLMGAQPTHKDDNIQSSLISMDAPVDRAAFSQGVAALPEKVLRAKGIVRFLDTDIPEVFQFVPGHTSLTPMDEEAGDSFMVIIGQDSPQVAEDFRSALGIGASAS